MKIGIISFQGNGDRLEHAGQTPEFYALTIDGVIVEYYTTLAALGHGIESIQDAVKADRATAITDEFKIAA